MDVASMYPRIMFGITDPNEHRFTEVERPTRNHVDELGEWYGISRNHRESDDEYTTRIIHTLKARGLWYL